VILSCEILPSDTHSFVSIAYWSLQSDHIIVVLKSSLKKYCIHRYYCFTMWLWFFLFFLDKRRLILPLLFLKQLFQTVLTSTFLHNAISHDMLLLYNFYLHMSVFKLQTFTICHLSTNVSLPIVKNSFVKFANINNASTAKVGKVSNLFWKVYLMQLPLNVFHVKTIIGFAIIGTNFK
jgi:hypothetical protein